MKPAIDWSYAAVPKMGTVRLSPHQYRKFKNEIHERDGWMCINPSCFSFRNGLTVHHVIRRSQGGGDVKENCVTVCIGCHDLIERRKISDRFCFEYLERLYGPQ